MPVVEGIVAHTSGITSINSLSEKNKRGVFYPLQTFTKERFQDLSEVPFCIEGIENDVTNSLSHLARKISNKVIELNSEQRKYLHLAAVMVNNKVV